MDIWTLPYAERKFLLIAETDSRNSREDQLQDSGVGTAAALAVAPLVARRALPLAASLVVPVAVPLAVGAYKLGKFAYDNWNDGKVENLNAVTPIRARLEDVRDLRFPAGHPLSEHLYVGHPLVPDQYYTVAEFHRCLFEHKCAEAVRLLMHLGATKIKVQRVEGWGKELASKMSMGGNFGASLKAKTASSAQLMFEMRLKNGREPALPDDLDWFRHEPTWQAIAEARIKFGLESASLQVEYSNDYGVDASLTAAAQKQKIGIGGSFEKFERTKWTVEGKFA